MVNIIERVYRSAVSVYKKRESAITTAGGLGFILLLSGVFIQCYRDPELYRELFVPGRSKALRADFEKTDGINLRVVPGTKAYLATLRESAQLGRGDELVVAMRRKVALASGCEPSLPVQINPDAEAKDMIMPGRDTTPKFLLTVDCS